MGTTEYTPGMRIRHPNKPEWGLGRIVHVDGPRVHVFFRDLPDRVAKKIDTNVIPLEQADEHSDPILDNLPAPREEDGKWVLRRDRITVKQARVSFLREFPGGFEDPTYIGDRQTGERAYKWAAHELFVEELGSGKAEELLSEGRVDDLSTKAVTVVSRVNLLSLYESAAFRDALEDLTAARRFFRTLIGLLKSPAISADVFEPYAQAVCDLPAEKGRVASWAVTTILPYLAQPDRHMFLKPEVTRKAADRLGFELHYDPTPNWVTYEALLRMSEVYRKLLADLGCRDMIDVQSFIWVTGTDDYRKSQ